MERLRTAAVFWICTLLFLTAQPGVRAQDTAGARKTPPETAKLPGVPKLPPDQRLQGALNRLQARPDVLATLHVEQKEPERGMGMAGGQMQVVVGGATPQKPFEGEAELWLRPQDGSLVVASKKKLPGFAVYHTPDRTITELLFEDEAPSLKGLNDELGPLFEINRLLRWVKRDGAGYKLEQDAAQGTTTLYGRAPRKAVRQPDGAAAMGVRMPTMESKVLRIETKFVFDEAGEMDEIAFTVVRNDPTAKFVREHLGKQGVPVPPENEDGETEGVSTVYRLRFDRKRPSPRAREFRDRITKHLAPKDE